MRYTHFGVGHSAMLRKIVKDCLGSHLVSSGNVVNGSSQEDADDEETCKGEGLGECDDGQEDNDGSDEDNEDEFSDGELDEGVDEDNGEDYEDELADELDGISF
jgi:hypothetical protein